MNILLQLVENNAPESSCMFCVVVVIVKRVKLCVCVCFGESEILEIVFVCLSWYLRAGHTQALRFIPLDPTAHNENDRSVEFLLGGIVLVC